MSSEDLSYSLYQRLTRACDRSGLRRVWLPMRDLTAALFDTWWTKRAAVRRFAEQLDDYDLDKATSERERFEETLRMLDKVRSDGLFATAIEIGCAEGVFTEMLALRCARLDAVDFLPEPLERVRHRRDWGGHVHFARFDLRQDPLAGDYQLIVLAEVLNSFHSPKAIRRARDKVVAALRPGGFLMFSSFLGTPENRRLYENSLWGKWLLRGGKWINLAMAEHHALEIAATAQTSRHQLTLFRSR